MRNGLAAFASVALLGCGAVVDDHADPARAAAAGARVHAPAQRRGDGGGGSVGGSGGSAPTASGPDDEAPGGAAGDDAGDDAHGVGFAAGGASPHTAVITRTLIDAPFAPRGFLSGMQYRPNADAATTYTIEAQFKTTRGQWDGCTQVRLGECWYYDCPPGSAPYLPSVPLQNAGTLSLTTDSDPVNTVEVGLLYDFWYETDAAGELWSASGHSLTFAATGNTVPAFALAIQSPPTVALLSLNGQATPNSITRSDGIALRWSSSGSGRATFTLYGFYERKFAATCEFDAAANAGQLPAVLLQELEPGPDYYVVFRGLSRAHGEVKGWQLEAALAGYGGPLHPFDAPTVALR